MAGWITIASLLITAPPPGGDVAAPPVGGDVAARAPAEEAALPPADPRLAVHVPRFLGSPRVDAAYTRSGGVAPPPACVADLCQPRVAVPGYDPRVTIVGRRTELAVKLLDRAHLEPFASFFWFLAATGLRLDYSPPSFDGPNAGRAGWGHAQVLLRWRIDASSAPVWPERHR
ncbi:hypothetical protein [Anaeromyxobacter oryzisoli]|uniref:hypothetical protein n=1 Tax=Anaeromyxobacter oryzisoli TaxID=2925408 RepID=UPI001F575F90|nr:hypothetical protein [Anaeromyxobacter sp. SG63]